MSGRLGQEDRIRKPKHGEQMVRFDEPCLSCGYNLRGLPRGGRCPECGEGIPESEVVVTGPKFDIAKQMVMDERERRLTTPPPSVKIRAEVHCSRCHHSLLGCIRGSRCPNCGKKIPLVGKETRYPGMAELPIGYTRLLRFGLLCMVLGWFGAVGGSLMALFSGDAGLVFALVRVVCAVAWVGGAVIVMRPRPYFGYWLKGGGTREWKLLRKLALWPQFAVPVMVLMLAGAVMFGSVLLAVFAALFGVIAAAGWVPVSLYLAHLAEWATDTPLAGKMRGTGWALATTGFLSLFVVPWALSPLHGMKAVAFIAIPFGLIGFPVAAIAMQLWMLKLFSTVRWAVANASAKIDVEARAIARTMADEEEGATALERAAAGAEEAAEQDWVDSEPAIPVVEAVDEPPLDLVPEASVEAVEDDGDIPLAPLEELGIEELGGGSGGDEPYRLELDEDDGPSDGADNGDAPYRLEEDK